MDRVVTVAELMRRCTPAPDLGDDDGAPIPVAALLRREGRSAAGLPVTQTPAVGEVLATLPARQPLLRRGAMAAGALLAAGSVFGLTAAMNGPVAPPTSSGVFPDQGEPGATSGGALDAGVAAPSSWLPVAFPTVFPEANAARAAAPQAPQAAVPQAPVRRAVPAQAPARQADPAPATTRSTPAKKDSGGLVSGTVDAVGGTVRDVGKDTPLKPVTDGLGDTVSDVGRTVGAVTDPITNPVTKTVERVVAPLTTPLTSALAPTTSASPTTTSKPTNSAKPSAGSSPTSAVTSTVKDLLG